MNRLEYFSYLYRETEEDLSKPPNFYRDIVGSAKSNLLRNCVGTLSKPLCAPTNIQPNQYISFFLRFIGGAYSYAIKLSPLCYS